ncbi:MAG: hypothetical protein M3Y09_16485 [Actinomycetota bacterium]|nr:hypothetical protein [Actinomycetota bacterium]
MAERHRAQGRGRSSHRPQQHRRAVQPLGLGDDRWPLPGKVDGISGDGNRLIATANEDGNSVLYVVNPGAPKKRQVTVTLATITTRKMTKVGTKTRRIKVVTHIAKLSPAFLDNSHATDAISASGVTLHLTDPDSNAFVPANSGDLFAGDYVLDSQADDQLVFAAGLGSGHAMLTRLPLTYVNPITQATSKAGIDDVRWAPADNATLYAVDIKANKVYKVSGPFTAGEAIASLDTVSAASTGTTLATLNDGSGELDPFITGLKAAKGLLFMP